MDKIFQLILDDDFADLTGATVTATIPVPQALINQLIQASLQGNRSLRSCQLSVHANNRVSVDIKTAMFPLPLTLKLRLDTLVDLASYASPKIRAWMENNRLLGSLGSLFNALPEGIRLYGDQVVIDLGVFLRKPEQKRLLEFVKHVGIQTQEGVLVMDVKLAVDCPDVNGKYAQS